RRAWIRIISNWNAARSRYRHWCYMVEQARPLALAKRQRLEIQCVDETVTVWADADRLSRVVANLVDNAIKYTDQGGSVLVRVEADDLLFARVALSDPCEGIARESRRRL